MELTPGADRTLFREQCRHNKKQKGKWWPALPLDYSLIACSQSGGRYITHEQFKPGDFDRLPPPRIYSCPNYSFCLNIEAVKDSTGFFCIGCAYWTKHERIEPHELGCCLDLLNEIFDPEPERMRIRGRWVAFSNSLDSLNRSDMLDTPKTSAGGPPSWSICI